MNTLEAMLWWRGMGIAVGLAAMTAAIVVRIGPRELVKTVAYLVRQN